MFFDKTCLRSSVRMRVFVPTYPTLTKCVSQIKAPVHGFSQPALSRVSKSDFIRHRERVEGKQLRPFILHPDLYSERNNLPRMLPYQQTLFHLKPRFKETQLRTISPLYRGKIKSFLIKTFDSLFHTSHTPTAFAISLAERREGKKEHKSVHF